MRTVEIRKIGSAGKQDINELRLCILCSLFLQTFLFFCAPLRKRMARNSIGRPLLFFAYLFASGIPNFALRLISIGQGDAFGPFANAGLLAFWAPFILVHLGGPDTITALALEDNKLWLRHLLGLGYKCWVVAYVLFQSFPNKDLWLPTVLMCIAGVIKYSERTRSLYLVSPRRFRDSFVTEPDPGPDYPDSDPVPSPSTIEIVPEPNRVTSDTENESDRNDLTDLQLVQLSYNLFETFKGLIADHVFSFREHSHSRDFFLKRTPREAFRVVEVELNFFYEILYTKAVVLQGKSGYPIRVVSFILYWVSLWAFYFTDKHQKGFQGFDIGITYALFLGAIAHDVIAFLMVLFSDWTAVSDYPPSVTQIIWKFLNVDRKRWSESLSQYGLIYRMHPQRIRLANIRYEGFYVKRVEFSNDMRDLIFEELRMKSEKAIDLETAKEIYAARGDWILRFKGWTEFLPWINEVDFDESLLLWHIATELCFNTDKVSTDTGTEGGNGENKDLLVLSKQLSDYMLYLLIVQPTMMSTVEGIGQVRYQDTCAEARRFFCGCFKKCRCKGKIGQFQVHTKACESILAVNTEVKPVSVKGYRSKSVLFDACILAKKLKALGEERRWVIISKVWVELLSYAACRCRAEDHAAQLRKGGELITLVWLLMDHLGLGNQYK